MSDSALRRDLRLRTQERILKLIEDTVSLYDMAELSRLAALQAAFEAMCSGVVILGACSDADPDEVGRMIAERIKRKRETECSKCDCGE